VTEGSGGVWERLHRANADGTTDLDAVVVREGKNLKGRTLALLFTLGGRRVLAKALHNTVRAIDARSQAKEAGARGVRPCRTND
jgi:hypothetical protein